MSKIIIASGPVIVENNRVLLDISSGDTFWKFCGGRPMENENLAETAIRRAKEELGIDIKILDQQPFLWHTIKNSGSEQTDIILAHYLASYTGEIVPGVDVAKWQWISISELQNFDLAPNIIPTLKFFGLS
jgi:8-oxo-dGTP pyrophosphatase MutT (NUDIX family)